MESNYKIIADLVLKYKDHRESLIRRTVILLIPVLASFDPEVFVSDYLSQCMNYLLSTLKKDRDRSAGSSIHFPYVAFTPFSNFSFLFFLSEQFQSCALILFTCLVTYFTITLR